MQASKVQVHDDDNDTPPQWNVYLKLMIYEYFLHFLMRVPT